MKNDAPVCRVAYIHPLEPQSFREDFQRFLKAADLRECEMSSLAKPYHIFGSVVKLFND